MLRNFTRVPEIAYILSACILLHMLPASARKEQFELVMGKGEEVCEAYERALESLDFDRPPWCDRPVNPVNDADPVVVDGFVPWQRIYLTSEQILPIYSRLHDFKRTGNQYQSELVTEPPITSQDARKLELVSRARKAGNLKVWRYEPALDVDNSGGADNTVLWLENDCRYHPSPTRAAAIFDKSTQVIFELKTQRIFGESRPFPVSTDSFIYRGNGPPGIFRYKSNRKKYLNEVFVDHWISGSDPWTKKENMPIDLVVYQIDQDAPQKICELRWTSPAEGVW